MTLFEGCNSHWMAGFCAQLYGQVSRYRQLAGKIYFNEQDSQKEHSLLMEAVIDGDADEAIKIMLSHYKRTADIIIESDLNLLEMSQPDKYKLVTKLL